jgi:hypothetical protein
VNGGSAFAKYSLTVLDADLITFLESGCSTIVGLLTPSGEPFATRGWGTVVVDPERPTVRLLVGVAAVASVGRRAGDGSSFAIAVTGADVRTLRSVQLKGTAHSLEDVTDDDLACTARFCDAMFDAIADVDGIRRELMERLAPADLVACTVDVDEMYDQTPGPGAGAPLAGRG